MSENKLAEAEIIKTDEDKKLVFGWASIIKDNYGKILLDRQDDFIDSEEELEKSAYSFVLNSRDGGEMHIRKGVSTLVESIVFTEEKQKALGIPTGTLPTGWWVGFRVNDDKVWEQVKKGHYIGFSVHGTGRREATEVSLEDITEIEKAEKKKNTKISTVMREFKAGKLKSSSGQKVTDPKQAMAIAISEQKRKDKMKKINLEVVKAKTEAVSEVPTKIITKGDVRLIRGLSVLLADTMSVYHEAHGFHWNVKGQDFSQYHELFEEIYTDLYGSIDPIAENILKMGADAPFHLSQFVAMRTIPESEPANEPQAMASALLGSLEGLLATLNMAFNLATVAKEQGIANFIAERIDSTQKWMWQLRSSTGVQKGEGPGHPFRGNQHTRGKGGVTFRGKRRGGSQSSKTVATPKEMSDAESKLTSSGLARYKTLREDKGMSETRRQMGIRSNTHEATMNHIRTSYPQWVKGGANSGMKSGRRNYRGVGMGISTTPTGSKGKGKKKA